MAKKRPDCHDCAKRGACEKPCAELASALGGLTVGHRSKTWRVADIDDIRPERIVAKW